MKTKRFAAFTLIEMLTVMAVIAILASLIVAVNGYAQKKSSLLRAEGEIKTMAAACEAYKAENGNYPRDTEDDSWTDKLDPRSEKDLNPTKGDYQKSSLFLYKCLSSDWGPGSTPIDNPKREDISDGKSEGKIYCEFAPNQLRKNSAGTEVRYIQDPFGNSYGYSTAGAEVEEDYREKVQSAGPKAERPAPKGFSPGFDLWSTGGVIQGTGKPEEDHKRWVKTWY
jgi:prepilin-type N-terminal cleavage/methylation domain-containing protein